MLNEKQIKEIREHLEKAQNPLFFFDNDVDGLSSFLLLRRFIDRGKGVAIKSFPELDVSYARKLYELNPDYIFVLDKPLISQGFINEVKKLALPFVWIDHHDVPILTDLEGISYYNSMRSEKPSSEPVSFWCYKIAGKKEDDWIALAGCIGDSFLPDFADEVEKKYPEIWKKVKTAFEGLYETDLGKISRILNFALKDTTSNVVNMLRVMIKAKYPSEILQEDKKNHLLYRFNQVNVKYQKLVEKASTAAKGKLLYFQYGGDLSLSGDISNELFYKFPDKIIVIVYINGSKANISLRGNNNVKELTLKAIEGIDGATGGGHEHATGAKMLVEDLPRFKEKLDKLVK